MILRLSTAQSDAVDDGITEAHNFLKQDFEPDCRGLTIGLTIMLNVLRVSRVEKLLRTAYSITDSTKYSEMSEALASHAAEELQILSLMQSSSLQYPPFFVLRGLMVCATMARCSIMLNIDIFNHYLLNFRRNIQSWSSTDPFAESLLVKVDRVEVWYISQLFTATAIESVSCLQITSQNVHFPLVRMTIYLRNI